MLLIERSALTGVSALIQIPGLHYGFYSNSKFTGAGVVDAPQQGSLQERGMCGLPVLREKVRE